MPVQTIRQFQEEHGLSRHKVDWLLRNGLPFVQIGSQKMIPGDAWERYLSERTVTVCPEKTPDHVFNGSQNVPATTSPGPNPVAASSAARALTVANSLKRRLPNLSEDIAGPPGRVIPMKR